MHQDVCNLTKLIMPLRVGDIGSCVGTVYTDHSACTCLLNTPNPSAKLARWAMVIEEVNLQIEHRSGKKQCSC